MYEVKKDFYIPSVRELLDTAAEKYGDKTFIKFVRDGKIEERSYNQVRSDSLAVCRMLRNITKERKHIAVIGHTSYEYLIYITGVLISGNVAIPLSPDISVAEASDLFNRGDIEMLFYEKDFEERLDEVREASSLKYCYDIGELENFNDIIESYSENSEFASLSDYKVDMNERAIIIFTSGTTGIKKGVMLSTKSLVGNVMYDEYCNMLHEGAVALTVLPMYHVYCFSGDYIRNLKDGVELCLNGNLRNLSQNLKIFQPTVMRLVPMIAQSLLQSVKSLMARKPSLSTQEAVESVFGKNLKWLISGGAYLNPNLVDEYEKLGILLRQGYGMTEAGCRISVPDENASKESVGRVTNICEVRVQNSEIQVKIPSVMLGYYKMPEETAECFTEDGWLKTGDIGTVTEDRQLFITGRAKNLIILSSGENVSPEAIEKKFGDFPVVEEILVYGDHDRIVAEIYPNFEYCKMNNITDIEAAVQKKIDELNSVAKASHTIAELRMRKEPFEKTGAGKIKRKETKVTNN